MLKSTSATSLVMRTRRSRTVWGGNLKIKDLSVKPLRPFLDPRQNFIAGSSFRQIHGHTLMRCNTVPACPDGVDLQKGINCLPRLLFPFSHGPL